MHSILKILTVLSMHFDFVPFHIYSVPLVIIKNSSVYHPKIDVNVDLHIADKQNQIILMPSKGRVKSKSKEKSKNSKEEETKEEQKILGKRKASEPKANKIVKSKQKNNESGMAVVKQQHERTLIDIIEDTKSGIPAKSEVVKREKKISQKKNKDQLSSISKESCTNKSTAGSKNQVPALPPPKPQQKPKIVLVNGRSQIQVPTVMSQSQIAIENSLKDKMDIQIIDSKNKKLTSLTYLPRQPSEKWKPEETHKFYKALQIFGTDFSLIEKLFNKGRTRDQIKNKFRKEEKKDKTKIDDLLSNKERLSVGDYEKEYGKIHLEEEGQFDVPDDIGASSSDEESSDNESESGTSQSQSNATVDDDSDLSPKVTSSRVASPHIINNVPHQLRPTSYPLIKPAQFSSPAKNAFKLNLF